MDFNIPINIEKSVFKSYSYKTVCKCHKPTNLKRMVYLTNALERSTDTHTHPYNTLYPFLNHRMDLFFPLFISSSVSESCPSLCDPIDCSTPGLPVHHQNPKFTQSHVHWVDDAIQPSHPSLLLLPSIFPIYTLFIIPFNIEIALKWPTGKQAWREWRGAGRIWGLQTPSEVERSEKAPQRRRVVSGFGKSVPDKNMTFSCLLRKVSSLRLKIWHLRVSKFRPIFAFSNSTVRGRPQIQNRTGSAQSAGLTFCLSNQGMRERVWLSAHAPN